MLATLLDEMAWYVVDGFWCLSKLILYIMPVHLVVSMLIRGSSPRKDRFDA